MSANPIDKQAIIKAAIPQLIKGISTEIIAQPYGITGRTLRNWLIADPDAEEARAQFLTEKIMDCGEALDAAEDNFPLARAREQFKYWSWIAERRLPSRFAPKQEINQGISISVQVHRTDDAQAKCITIDQGPPLPLPGALSDGGGGK